MVASISIRPVLIWARDLIAKRGIIRIQLDQLAWSTPMTMAWSFSPTSLSRSRPRSIQGCTWSCRSRVTWTLQASMGILWTILIKETYLQIVTMEIYTWIKVNSKRPRHAADTAVGASGARRGVIQWCLSSQSTLISLMTLWSTRSALNGVERKVNCAKQSSFSSLKQRDSADLALLSMTIYYHSTIV